jgi:hypothetical protein
MSITMPIYMQAIGRNPTTFLCASPLSPSPDQCGYRTAPPTGSHVVREAHIARAKRYLKQLTTALRGLTDPSSIGRLVRIPLFLLRKKSQK